ncbi:hypothetical protein BD413DRAFT_15268 [Trametes elegans]|nr:hypothetical protein BD413DRAFT_15268 [Trametes elegans]
MASSLSPVVQLYQSIFATNCCQIAAAVILSYDTLLGFDREIRVVWRSPKHGASLLYWFNRYLQLASIYLSLAVTVLQLDTKLHGPFLAQYCHGGVRSSWSRW